MFGHESKAGVKALLEEGYYGATNYHEWGNATAMSYSIDENQEDREIDPEAGFDPGALTALGAPARHLRVPYGC